VDDYVETWKQIAAFVGRSERWCRYATRNSGMPVKRMLGRVRMGVAEYDAWVQAMAHKPLGRGEERVIREALAEETSKARAHELVRTREKMLSAAAAAREQDAQERAAAREARREARKLAVDAGKLRVREAIDAALAEGKLAPARRGAP
jgi:C4-dicarboxylate-specific signal transduction histidine kinase